jgi:hypothetical protein
MAKPKKWLKLDRLAKVRVAVTGKYVEFRVLVPAKRMREQLLRLGK